MLDMSTIIHEVSQSRRALRHMISTSPPTALDNNINNGIYDSGLTAALT